MNRKSRMAQRGWYGGERVLAVLLAAGFALSAGPLMATPEVTTLEADDVTASGALLRGELTSLGSEAEVDAFFRWREFDFDGVSLSGSGGSGVEIDSNIGVLSNSDVSVSMWIKPDNWDDVQQFFFLGGGGVALEALFNPNISGNAVIRVFWYSSNAIQINLTVPTADLPSLGEWSHIAVVYARGSPDSLSFYVNGDHVVTATHAAANYSTTGADVYFGNHSNASLNRDFKGGMSDVRIYTNALSATDVENLSTGQLIADDLVARWKLDDGAGTTAADSSGNGYDGTVVGGTWISPPWTATTASTLDSVGEFDAPLAGLDGVTDYHYQAVAQWDGGASEVRGENVRFATLFGDPVVETEPPSAVTGESATLSGTLVDAGASTPTAISVHWGLTDGGTAAGAWADDHEIDEDAAEGPYTHDVTELVTNRVYFYRFSATDASAQTVWGEAESFLTGLVGIEDVSDADENGLQPGSFRVLRHADATNGPVTVFYTIDAGSTAVLDVNYEAPTGYDTVSGTGTVVMAEDEAEATITVTPILDASSTGDTVLTLNLASDVRYLIDSTSDSASITIAALSYPGAPTNTWIGSGNASDAANWSLGEVPTSGHDILLGAFSTENMTWDYTTANALTNHVASWTQTADYTGTVTFKTTYPEYTTGDGALGFTNFTISGDASIAGGSWTHVDGNNKSSAPWDEYYRLRVSVGGNLTLSGTASIDVKGRGFNAERGPGYEGGTAGGNRSTGGYGGAGTRDMTGANLDGPTYGSITTPTNLGSGGRQSAGGGAVYLTAASMSVDTDAMIRADGADQVGSGSGSGGSVYVVAGAVTIDGILSADGGASTGDWIAGAGGRVAVILTNALASVDTLGAGTIRAQSGYGARGISGAGTVYLEDSTHATGQGVLIVNNGNLSGSFSGTTARHTPVPPEVDVSAFARTAVVGTARLSIESGSIIDFDALTLDVEDATSSTLVIVDDTDVDYGTTLTVENFHLIFAGEEFKPLNNLVVEATGILTGTALELALQVDGDLTIQDGGLIRMDGGGPADQLGTPERAADGQTYTGGGHAGQGGENATSISRPTYGSYLMPDTSGSRGDGFNVEGRGGRVVTLNIVGLATIDGLISANGAYGRASGSGGSIFISAGTITGGGSLQVNGGELDGNRGAGAGGRLAVILNDQGADFSSFDVSGTMQARSVAGTGSHRGAAGSIYRQTGEQGSGEGTVIIDNAGAVADTAVTQLPPSVGLEDDLSKTAFVVSGAARLQLTDTITISSVDIVADSELDLQGHTLHVRALTIAGDELGAGTYSAADLDGLGYTQVIDTADPANGQIVLPAGGSLFLLR